MNGEVLYAPSRQEAPRVDRRHFKPALEAAGLDSRLRFHDLRHTCAALLIAQGAHAKEIQERLGHSTIRVTFDTYGHLLPSLDERLRDGLEDTYQRAAAEALRNAINQVPAQVLDIEGRNPR